MRPVFNGTIFIQFLLIGLVLGITLVNVLLFSELFRALASIVYVVVVLMETFPFCYLCDLLAEDCYDLSNLLGHSYWIDAEPKYKFTLRIFMLHLQNPIRFKAGGTFPISMNSNIKVSIIYIFKAFNMFNNVLQVAKFAVSVITIVKKLNLAERFQ